MQLYIFGLLLVVGICFAEIEIPDHPTNLDEVPAIKERCEKKGKTDSYDRLKVAMNETRTCLEGKINPSKIKEELEEAKKTGSMDEVFAKYCNKRQDYKDCFMKTVNVAKECMEQTETSALDTAIRVIDEVAEFACYRDGDRLAMFVAEGGIDCVSSRTEQIKNCVNETLKIDTSNFSFTSLPTNLPTLEVDHTKCDNLAKIQQCVVKDLETNCKDTTPANIVDALFKFVKKSTCKNIKQKRSVAVWRLKRDIDVHAIRMINSSAIKDKFAEECRRNGGEKANSDFWNAIFSAQSCFGKSRIFVTPKDEYLNNLRSCTEEHLVKVENCLTEELKFYPKFIITAMEALVEFLYDHLNLNKLTPKSEIVFCLQRIKAVGGIQKHLPLCTQGLIPNQTEMSHYSIPNKETICKLLTDLDGCVNNFIKNTCAPDIVVDRFLGNFTEALQKPCRDEQLVSNF